MSELDLFKWPNPWHAIVADDERTRLTAELSREVTIGHVLWGRRFAAIARRCDRDDVLFRIDENIEFYAEVHLTWAAELDVRWPVTRVFPSIDEWHMQCSPD